MDVYQNIKRSGEVKEKTVYGHFLEFIPFVLFKILDELCGED